MLIRTQETKGVDLMIEHSQVCIDLKKITWALQQHHEAIQGKLNLGMLMPGEEPQTHLLAAGVHNIAGRKTNTYFSCETTNEQSHTRGSPLSRLITSPNSTQYQSSPADCPWACKGLLQMRPSTRSHKTQIQLTEYGVYSLRKFTLGQHNDSAGRHFTTTKPYNLNSINKIHMVEGEN